MSKKNGELVSYEMVKPGFEGIYTGETDLSKYESDEYLTYKQDEKGNVYWTYSLWGFAHASEENWNEEIKYINKMEEKLGKIDKKTRKIRQQIASLVCCDSGIPVTIDEILNAIGNGFLPEPSFHPGCWMSIGKRTTQPYHGEVMSIIEEVLKGFLRGEKKGNFIKKFPQAKGFITRTYSWLGPKEEFSKLQELMLERMLLPFDFFTGRNENYQEVHQRCFVPGGEGEKLDEKIAELADLPKIYADYKREYYETRKKINDPDKREIYKICGHITHGVRGLSDCHHSTFCYFERWIHGIGTLRWEIPTREKGREKERLGQLLFGYALGLDRWLQGIPHQFLLMDLGYIDLGFNPKNEISRVFAYLENKQTPVKKWLAACLWYSLTMEPPAGVLHNKSHNNLIEKARKKGIDVREWIDYKSEF